MSTPTLPQVRVDLPPGFAGLPISTSDEQNAAQVWALAGKVAEETGQSREEFAQYLHALTPGLAEQGVRLFGRFAVGDDNPGLATLTVAIQAWPARPPEGFGDNPHIVAAALAEQYRERHPGADARAIPLAIGPAMVAVEQGEFRLPPAVTGDDEVVRPGLRIEVQIPLPDNAGLAVLSVVSGDEAQWEAVVEQTRLIANSVRVDEAC
ncbi:hypothetical protein [Amycolatopsis sp. NPDC059021]|uniref:hypothetical protein n=1 Tax=Amycolatopsis sp. NPDC059021 TaxID=3346704 RepID=UPI003671A3F0